MKDVLELCKELAVEAGKAIMEIYNDADDLQVEYKDGEMPLTVADRVSNNIIVSSLRERYADYANGFAQFGGAVALKINWPPAVIFRLSSLQPISCCSERGTHY